MIFSLGRTRKIIKKIINRLANDPSVFILLRRLLENNFRGIKSVIRKEMSIERGNILDVGCGTGEFSVFFNHKDYFGIDINEGYINYAIRKHKRIFKVMDAQALEFADNSFDNVIVLGVFHHLSNDQSFRVLKEIKRVLRCYGKLFVIEDIHVRSRYNLIGKVLQILDKGDFIRNLDEYTELFSKYFDILRKYPTRNVFCDYHVFVLRHQVVPR